MSDKAKEVLEQYERDNDYPKMKRELLVLFDISGELPDISNLSNVLIEALESPDAGLRTWENELKETLKEEGYAIVKV